MAGGNSHTKSFSYQVAEKVLALQSDALTLTVNLHISAHKSH